MNKAKLIFNQSLMISTAMLFGMGVRTALMYLIRGEYMIRWEWYIPLSIILTGVMCATASLILYGDEKEDRGRMIARICIHFLLVFGIVSLCGRLFAWYSDLFDYLLIVVMYVVIYAFVWISTSWMLKSDEKKINKAIDEIRDDE